MARLFVTLVAIVTLSACSSGVSNTGAGAAGTDCGSGGLDLICTAQLSAPTTIFACTGGSEDEGGPVAASTTDTANLNIIVNDPLGKYSNTFQGMTFETYDVSFNSGQGGAPNLGSRRFTNTLTFQLINSTGSGNVVIPFLDETTKREFAKHASCSTIYPYVVTVRAAGRDFATNTPVAVVARINVGIGGTTGGNGGDEEENGENGENGEEE